MRFFRASRVTEVFFFIFLAGILSLTGCGSTGDSEVYTGNFVDSPVEGLGYSGPNFSGFTAAGGGFKYAPDDSIDFYLGGINLGAVLGQPLVSPLTLYGVSDVTDNRVTNLAVLLQSLDEDGDLNNGITITQAMRDIIAALACTINFDQDPALFQADNCVLGLMAALNQAEVFTDDVIGDRMLVSAADAQAHCTASLGPRNEVATTGGTVSGYTDENDTWAWKGIPFAKAPVGALRWMAPQNPNPFGQRQALAFPSPCPQYYDSSLDALPPAPIGGEDCLYLNVWRPQTQESGLPVYFWIHGGGNSIGSTSTAGANGIHIASRSNMVVVTTQYRLGPLGWFTHPDLRTGNVLDDSGNYGTMDMAKALEWVRDNIAAFGGDPNNITIAGESAGGTNVFTMVMSPLAAGLFHKGIAQSGGTGTTTVATGEAHAAEVVQRLLAADDLTEVPGGDTAAYLRSKTPYEILDVYDAGIGGMISQPKIYQDGAVIPADGFYTAVAQGQYNQTPMIMGTNKEEMKLFMAGNYGSYPSDEAYQAAAIQASDGWKLSGVDYPAMAMLAMPGQPDIYAYQFLYGAWNPEGYNAWNYPYNVMFGSAHALEIPFFWGNYWFFGYEPLIFREDNRLGREALTTAMMAYAAQFARTGDPGAAGGVEWDAWSNNLGGPKRILFDADATNTIIEMSIY